MSIKSQIKESKASLEKISNMAKQIDSKGKGISIRTLGSWIAKEKNPRTDKLILLLNVLNEIRKDNKKKPIGIWDLIH